MRELFYDGFGYPCVARDVSGAAKARGVNRCPHPGIEAKALACAVFSFDGSGCTHDSDYGAKPAP
jgi:hypothetical protein